MRNIESLPKANCSIASKAAERALLQMGITFNVYGERAGTEKIFPFDLVPRIVAGRRMEPHRARPEAAHPRAEPVHRRPLPRPEDPQGRRACRRNIVFSSKAYRKQCMGFNPPRGIWCHVTGTDLVRHRDGQIYVLEDNLRCPSGVSYVLENRAVMKSMFPQVFARVEDPAGVELSRAGCATCWNSSRRIIVTRRAACCSRRASTTRLTSSIRFSRSRWASNSVEGRDLVVDDGFVVHAHDEGLRARGCDLSAHRR